MTIISGKDRRLARLFGPDGRTFLVAADHGVTTGFDSGLGDMAPLLAAVAEGGADGVVVHRGTAKRHAPVQRGTALVVHLSGSTDLSPDGDVKTAVCSVESAVALGADAISVHVTLGCGAADDRAALADLGAVSTDCERFGMPLLVMTYVRPGGPRSAGAAALHAARVAAEMGADVVKATSPDLETSHALATKIGVPVVVAGGETGRGATFEDFLETSRLTLETGVAGLCVGRWVFTHTDPARATRALRDLVHPTDAGGSTPREAPLGSPFDLTRA